MKYIYALFYDEDMVGLFESEEKANDAIDEIANKNPKCIKMLFSIYEVELNTYNISRINTFIL